MNTYETLVTWLEHKATGYMVVTPYLFDNVKGSTQYFRFEIHHHDSNGNVKVDYKIILSLEELKTLLSDIALANDMEKR
jgi:hypothetical protein